MTATSIAPTLHSIDSSIHNAPLAQRILLWFLQVFGALAVVIFGTFTILSWRDAEHAKTQADTANLISFLQLCDATLSNNGPNNTESAIANLCNMRLTAATKQLEKYVNSTFPAPALAGLPGDKFGNANYGLITGIAIGSAFVVMIITILTLFSFERRRALRHLPGCQCGTCSRRLKEKEDSLRTLTKELSVQSA